MDGQNGVNFPILLPLGKIGREFGFVSARWTETGASNLKQLIVFFLSVAGACQILKCFASWNQSAILPSFNFDSFSDKPNSSLSTFHVFSVLSDFHLVRFSCFCTLHHHHHHRFDQSPSTDVQR